MYIVSSSICSFETVSQKIVSPVSHSSTHLSTLISQQNVCVCVCVCVCARALPQHIRCAPTHISVRVLLLSHHRGWFTLVSQARLCLLGVIVPWFFISLALCLVPSTWQELSSFIHFFINICYSYALC